MLYSPCGLRPLERLAQVQAQLANLQVALSASRHHKSRSNASTGWLLHICMISIYIYIYITVLVGCGHWSRWHGRRRRCFGHRGWQSSMWHCLQASQVEIEGINCMRKVAIAYMHDQFYRSCYSPCWVAATGAAGTGAGAGGKSAGGTACKQASQVEIKCINCMRKVVIAYMHDQFIDIYIYIYHSPGWLRPLEPLARAQAQVLRPQGLVALPTGITSQNRRHPLQSFFKHTSDIFVGAAVGKCATSTRIFFLQ